MDHLERLYRHLVRTIRASFPQYLSRPFEVAELYQTIMPYRHHRRELGFDSNQDYEMAVLELLSGKGGYLIVEDRMREALTRELASANPDPGAFREYATKSVQLAPEALQRLEASAADARAGANSASTTRVSAAAPMNDDVSVDAAPHPRTAEPARISEPVRASTAAATFPTPVGSPRMSAGLPVEAGEHCRYCGGDLPPGRRIVFCPHCGQNLTVVNCMACGTELELGWKFCTTCGRPNTASTSG